MPLNNNNIKGIKKVKLYPNHCRTWIGYNERLNRFVEAMSGKIHRCPKWKPNLNKQRKTPYRKIKTLKRQEFTLLDPASLTIEDTLSIHQENLILAELARQNADKSK